MSDSESQKGHRTEPEHKKHGSLKGIFPEIEDDVFERASNDAIMERFRQRVQKEEEEGAQSKEERDEEDASG